nr:VCBS repeat-containing protein [Microcystis aeruginosa BS13-10]
MNPSLLPSLAAVDDILFNFAQSDGFWANWSTAFGTSYDVVKATQLRQQWQSRDFSQLPPIEVLSGEVLGTAKGAYAVSTNKIYLSASFLNTAAPAAIVDVIVEEIGHFIDAQINSSDTPGDEGQLFSVLVRGESLTAAEIAAIQSENDAGTILVEGQAVSVEMAVFNVFSSVINSVGTYPYSVRLGDFNGDGKLDLATANNVANNVSVLLGNGTGSFSTATNFSVGTFPRSVTLGDFNGDGK